VEIALKKIEEGEKNNRGGSGVKKGRRLDWDRARCRRVGVARKLSHRARRRLILAAEVALVFLILALLVAVWMPALVGARPGR